MRIIIKNAAAAADRMRAFTTSPSAVTLAQQLGATAEKMRAFTTSPGAITAAQQLAATTEKMRAFTTSPGFTSGVEKMLQAIRSPGFISGVESAVRTMRWLREWDESERRILELLAPRGWLISAETSLTEVHQLLAIADAEGVEAVEEALVSALTPQRCREIIESLYETDAFAEWREAFEQALGAHEQGSYALSVPIWLIAFEGVWRAELGVGNIFSRIKKKRGSSIVRATFPFSRDRLVNALIGVMVVVAESRASAADGLRRHVVMHGLDPKFGTKKASVQGILMLEALHSHLQEHDDLT
jgi:hypothetical protein